MAHSYKFLIILCFAGVYCDSATGPRWGPWVKPETFVDNYETFITFECTARLAPKQLLSWYQIKTNEPKPILLAIIQQEYLTDDIKMRINNSITLYKTLDQSDNGSKVCCTLQKVLPGGKFSEIEVSRNISIVFHRNIEPLELPYINLDSKDRTVYFDVNSTLYFNCTGSKPVNGRSYTWLMQSPDSKLMVPLIQKYDRATNWNSLALTVDESYHGYQLFCAQEFHLYINQTDGFMRRNKYGELVRSDMITLVQRGKEDKTYILALVLPVLLVAIASIIVAVLWVKLRGNQEDSSLDPALVSEDKDYDIYDSNYATAQVTYAVLDLEQADPAVLYAAAAQATPVKQESRNYVKIIGVIKPKAETCK